MVLYAEYLGAGYVDEVRKMLGVNDDLVPDSMVNAEYNIGAMRMIIGEQLRKNADKLKGDEEEFAVVQKASRHCLCAVLCTAIISRVKNPTFSKYRHRNWKKKREKHMEKCYQVLRSKGLLSNVFSV